MFGKIALATCLALPSLPAFAQSTDRVENLQAALLPGWQAANGSHIAGLQLSLGPGWKTYWRSPGEAGLPPMFNWSGSVNVKSVRVLWPNPDVFETNGMQSIGYHDEVLLPLEVMPRDASLPVELHAAVDLGICRDICLPASLTLSNTLSIPGTAVPAISAALADRPHTATEAGLARVTCDVSPIADGMRVTATLALPTQGAHETVVFEAGQPDIWVAATTSARRSDTLTAVTEMVAPTGAPFALARSDIRITVIGKDKSVEISGCPAP